MRRSDFLINAVREVSRNLVNGDGTTGVLDNTILRYLNEGKDRIQSLISALKNVQRPFVTSKDIATIAGQRTYVIPDRVSMNKQIVDVLFSTDGLETNYVPLEKLQFVNQLTSTSTYPIGYIVRNGAIELHPAPASSAGKIRVSFERQIDDLDVRRGLITTVNGLTSTGFTSIVLDATADTFETTTPGYAGSSLVIDYICICDIDGIVSAYNIPMGSYVTGTNTFSPRAGYVFQTGETIVVNSYVTFGKYSSTHYALPDMCEPYLVQYAAMKVMEQDSAEQAQVKAMMVGELEDQILKQVRTQTAEVQYIPERNISEWY